MIDQTTEAGARAERRLQEELVIWLTTVRSDGQPQTSPVWFLWDGQTFLTYSRRGAQKLRNIAHHPRVSLHLDGNGRGGDIVTIEGMAALESDAPLADSNPQYVAKYRDSIGAIGYTPEGLARDYPDAIRVTPHRIRTW